MWSSATRQVLGSCQTGRLHQDELVCIQIKMNNKRQAQADELHKRVEIGSMTQRSSPAGYMRASDQQFFRSILAHLEKES